MNRDKLIAIIKKEMLEQGAEDCESGDRIGIDYGAIDLGIIADAILTQYQSVGISDRLRFSTELLVDIQSMYRQQSLIVEIVAVRRDDHDDCATLLIKNVPQ
jgi:hypothetical protein